MESLPTELFTYVFSLVKPPDRLLCTMFDHPDGCDLTLKNERVWLNFERHKMTHKWPRSKTILRDAWNNLVLKYNVSLVTIVVHYDWSYGKMSDMSTFDMRNITHLDLVIEQKDKKFNLRRWMTKDNNIINFVHFKNVSKVERLRIKCDTHMPVYISCTDSGEVDDDGWTKLKEFESTGPVHFRGLEIPDVARTTIWTTPHLSDWRYTSKNIKLFNDIGNGERVNAKCYFTRPNVTHLELLQCSISIDHFERFVDAFCNVRILDLRKTTFSSAEVNSKLDEERVRWCFPNVDTYMGKMHFSFLFPNCRHALVEWALRGMEKIFPKLEYLSYTDIESGCVLPCVETAHTFCKHRLDYSNCPSTSWFPSLKNVIIPYCLLTELEFMSRNPVLPEFVKSVRSVSDIPIATHKPFLKFYGDVILLILWRDEKLFLTIPKDFYMECIRRQCSEEAHVYFKLSPYVRIATTHQKLIQDSSEDNTAFWWDS